MNRPVLIVAALLLVGALTWLTHSMNKSVTPGDDDAPPPATTKPTPPPSAGAQAIPLSAVSADLPSELVLGDPKTARHVARIGWTYDAKTQANPQSLSAAVTALRGMPAQSGGQVAIVVVNLDVPGEDRSPLAQSVTELGLTMDGRPVAAGELGQGDLTAGNLAQKMMAAGAH